MEARYYRKLTGDKIQCTLCPHNCLIADGKSGICRVRSNDGGILYSDMYDCLAATQFDPIEKKPLYHFYPGSEILSLGGLGCNFRCSCCQNYEISQTGKAGFPRLQYISVQDVVKTAIIRADNLGIAYTYNEPFIWYEFMFDIARQIKKYQGKNVIVSNGYINEKPLKAILPFIDAFNIDIKSFDEEMYRKFTGGDLNSILKNLKIIVKSGKHLEITMLIIPGINDVFSQFETMVQWLVSNLGKDVPLHLSRYFPHYQLKTNPTSLSLINEFAEYAGNYLSYIYTGNTPGNEHQNTICPNCGTLVIRREGYLTRLTALDAHGFCSSCGQKIVIF